VRARGTLGGSVANNDPAACYPSAVLGLGATVHTNQRKIAADDFFQGMYTTALEEGELITAIRFPIPEARGLHQVQAAGLALCAGGRVCGADRCGVRVAVTGAASCVFRHAGWRRALNQSFTPQAAAA
jgi:carbon-monoxide dehydrogenase medium subunit